jgi:LysR family transcriptional regulator, hydrogen peroxide-inducible genes activator
MELRQIRSFVTLCRTLNFTRAAEACNVGQSALSRYSAPRARVRRTPPRRERKLTQLTELGRVVRPMLEQSLATALAAKTSAEEFNKGEKTSLRLGIASTIFAGPAAGALSFPPSRSQLWKTRSSGWWRNCSRATWMPRC